MSWRARSRAAQNAGAITRDERLKINEVADGATVPTEAKGVAAKIEKWEKEQEKKNSQADGAAVSTTEG